MAWSVGVHEGPLRRAVVDYKYRRRERWGPILGRLVAGWLEAHAAWVEDFDLLLPVPAYRGTGARRSWDPVGELASHVAALTGPAWEVVTGAVVKVAETPPLAGRGRSARRQLAEGPLRAALEVTDRTLIAGARILVLDDVLTEGATLREVARCLRLAGAVEVAGLAVTRPGWGGGAPPTVDRCRPA